MRTSDRQRAIERRTHQHGETEVAYVERIRQALETSTGLVVKITHGNYSADPYTIEGFTPRGERLKEPLVRVTRQMLDAAANAFEAAADRIAGRRTYFAKETT